MYDKILVMILMMACVSGCFGRGEEPATSRPESILFVGNSFTSANGGLDLFLKQMTSDMPAHSQPFAAAMTVDGATLKQLWNVSAVRQATQSGAYEVLVLQEDLPEGDIESFRKYASKFVAESASSGTRPVLLMGWAYERLNWISQEEIAAAHNSIAKELAADVAPVGLAWMRVMAERPKIQLFSSDGEHPSMGGSYLTACVVYATVMASSPEGANHQFLSGNVGEEEARYLERVAWNTVQAYRRAPQ